ncbi:MAG: TolC family protein [bacterium]|nr:TolC family protein [bacterium]
MRRIFILMIGVLYACAAFATTEYTVSDAIDRALDVDRTYEEAQLNTEQNYTAVNAAKGAFFPRLSFDAYANKTYNLPGISIPADTFFDGQPEIDIPMGYDEQVNLSLTMTQPIYLAGIEWAAYDMAKKSSRLADEQERAAKEDVIYDVSTTYYGVLLAEDAVAVAENSYEVAQSHLESTREVYDAGLVSEYDVLRAQVQVTNLFNARNRAYDGAVAARRGLKLLLELPEDEDIVLLDTMKVEFEEFNLDEVVETARDNRSDPKQLERSIGLAEANVSMEKSATRPTVAFMASAQEQSNKFTFDTDYWSDTYNLTFSVSWPFFDSFVTPTIVKIAKYDTEKLKITRDLAEDAMELEIKGLYDRYLTDEETVLSNEENVRLAERGYEIAEARYNAGLMTNLEVLDAQSALTQTQLGYYSALNDYFVTRMDLLKAMGTIIEYYDK